MDNRTVTVQDAIERGLKQVALPSKMLMTTGIAMSVIMVAMTFSFWYLLLFPSGILLSFLYTAYATPRWRIWAYEYCNDIHQFQRSAELAGLLVLQSYESTGGFMSGRERDKLVQLLKRFSEQHLFVDDSSIPKETCISNEPIVVLNDSGIQVESDKVAEWSEIEHERIATETYSRMSARTGYDVPAGSKDFFRFQFHGQRFDMALSSLNISKWKLDLLLYIYKGRSEL